MAKVIPSVSLVSHSINKYNFKTLDESEPKHSPSNDSEFKKTNFTNEPKESAPIIKQNETVDTSSISRSSQESLIESLLKKTDEMSSNFIKLQMKLEDKEEEYKVLLQKEKEKSFAEGVEAGKAQASVDIQKNYNDGLNQFSASVGKLDNSSKEFERALEGIKENLISAALDIAKEVVSVELNSNSQEVAKKLSSELIKELQSASKVTLKVNPKDHGAISEFVGLLDNVEVMSDSAVSVGGVVALSDAGNVDAQISKRFERVKKAALS